MRRPILNLLATPIDPVARAQRWVPAVVAAFTLVLLAITVFHHPTPLYFVETDLVGEYIPAARSLAEGRIDAGHYSFKGPGYPLLLAAVAPLCGGDYWLGARVLSALATGAAAWLAFLVVRSFAGPLIALMMLGGLLLNPAFVRYGIEAGTDAPALALSLLATWGVLRSPARGWTVVAGLAAGYAVVTRYNAAFLLPAAALVLLSSRERRRDLIGYAAAAALPIVGWMIVNHRIAGHALQSNNYLNIAYDLYGRDLTFEVFEAQIGSRFRSLGDVLAFDPALAAARVAWNLGAHFVADLGDLLPVWLGVIAGPGLLWSFRRREWRPAALHFALCALVLAPVFYSARFSLYLLPFYLAGAAALMLELPRRIAARLRGAEGRARRLRLGAWMPTLGGALLVASGVVAGVEVRRHLATAPHETRLMGSLLSRRGGGRIMARKPHVAHFAGMAHVPMSLSPSLVDLIARAREAGADYLFYSPIERMLRPEYVVLSDSGVALPGLEQVAWREWEGRRFAAVYRFTGAAVDSASMAWALERQLDRYLERHRSEPGAHVFVALHHIDRERPRAALDLLLPLERAGVRDPAVATLISTAWFQLGENERAYRACERALELGPATAWHLARLGDVRRRQARHAEARDWYRRAVDLEPGNLAHLESLALVSAELGDFAPAAATFERCIRLAPRDARLRRYAMGAYQLAGNNARAKEIFEAGIRLGVASQLMLDPVAPGR